MRLGIGSYTFAWAIGGPGYPPRRPMDAFALLDEAVRLRVSVAQFCDNLPLTRLSAAELDRFQEKAARSGITLEVGTRGIGADNLRAHLALCRRFGSPFLRVVIDSPGDEPTPDQALARLRQILPEFVRAGVRLAIENHDRFTSESLAT